MSMKQAEIERLERDLAEAIAARTELSERLEVQAARVVNLQRHIEDLQGTVESLLTAPDGPVAWRASTPSPNDYRTIGARRQEARLRVANNQLAGLYDFHWSAA